MSHIDMSNIIFALTNLTHLVCINTSLFINIGLTHNYSVHVSLHLERVTSFKPTRFGYIPY